ncbi:hypothetical protein SB379_24530 [Burkholderia multivorans]|uniref:hypothetical protein n=1 Tax=Burkholderia multivorans TaxID=87883 RepID=UPI000D34614E|nr:hypothetical protein [Burkholderia multivorans]MEB2510591.1 hypothetical protein [Burkholderia multivorans]MEB2524649.1 hypothetical protein [Burkholderia multivorans]MEB2575407.1 hypothetical protein [Burkholderia multivorans]MEB2591567.1 hypothetical protein [Burkholderia multivorans]PTO49691.1 hypothetical protein DBB31_06945 [Burkholderia multivorans]
MSSIDYGKLFRFLFEVPLWEELNRAERGDEEAARNVLGAIAFLTSTKNVHPNTGEVLPVPGFVRDYLSRAFGRMAAGVSPDKALHLNQGKKGRSPDSYSRKILAASIVEYLHRFHELPVDQACSKAEEVIGGIIEAPQIRCSLGPWEPFRGKKVCNEDSIRKYYYDQEVQESIKRSRAVTFD